MKKSLITTCVLLFLFSCSKTLWGQKVLVQNNNETVSISNALFSIDFNLKTGMYNGVDKQANKTVFTDARFTLDELTEDWKMPKYSYRWSQSVISDSFGNGVKLIIEHRPEEGYQLQRSLEVSLYENLPYAVLGFSVTNQNN